MQGRFQRGKVGGVSPFFAFQDIITSAMAVLITVVMLLALDMGTPSARGKSDPSEPAPDSLLQRWRQTMDELAATKVRLQAAQDAVVGAKLDPAILQGQIDSLRAELDALHARIAVRTDQLQDARQHDGAAVVWSELARQKAATEAARARVEELTTKDKESREVMERAERAVRYRESQLLDAQSRKNEIWLVPDRTTTTKEPVLAIVTESTVELRRFDHPEKTEVTGFGLRSKFEKALGSFSKLDQYVVFYFKPSGVDHFNALTEAARQAGFEIGYDAVGEDVVVNFGSGK